MERAKRREAGRETRGIALEGGAQVLDEVDLVDVAAADRLLGGLDRGRVALVVPAALPVTDPERARRGRLFLTRVDAGGEQRQPAGLWRIRPARAPERVRAAVAEDDVGDVVLACKEARVVEVGLDLGEGIGSAPDFEHGVTLARDALNLQAVAQVGARKLADGAARPRA